MRIVPPLVKYHFLCCHALSVIHILLQIVHARLSGEWYCEDESSGGSENTSDLLERFHVSTLCGKYMLKDGNAEHFVQRTVSERKFSHVAGKDMQGVRSGGRRVEQCIGKSSVVINIHCVHMRIAARGNVHGDKLRTPDVQDTLAGYRQEVLQCDRKLKRSPVIHRPDQQIDPPTDLCSKNVKKTKPQPQDIYSECRADRIHDREAGRASGNPPYKTVYHALRRLRFFTFFSSPEERSHETRQRQNLKQ